MNVFVNNNVGVSNVSPPTIDTLVRYADAVGKELVIELVDKGAPAATGVSPMP
jgi:hypothetical protein